MEYLQLILSGNGSGKYGDMMTPFEPENKVSPQSNSPEKFSKIIIITGFSK